MRLKPMVSIVLLPWARQKLKNHAAEADGICRVLALARQKLKNHAAEAGGWHAFGVRPYGHLLTGSIKIFRIIFKT